MAEREAVCKLGTTWQKGESSVGRMTLCMWVVVYATLGV